MRDEIALMGAGTPHELMRAVEVSFIRDCAEMAARSSLTRTESRWGLYHDRADLPARDDADWGYHLNLRKDPGGDMVFLKRPVAPYFVSVPEFDGLPPTDQGVREVTQPPLIGGQAPPTARSRIVPVAAADPPSPRIAEVLALAEPTIAELSHFLADSDAGVRRTAVATLTEHIPDGYAPALLAALNDTDASVRRTAAEGVRELVEVLPDPAGARPYLESPDSVVRAAALSLLAARRVGSRRSSVGRSTTPTTGCVSRRYVRWCPSTTWPEWLPPPPTRTARFASRRRPATTLGDGTHAVGALIRTRTPWCARRH